MNFFGHAVFAARVSSSASFVLGAMLPDFAAMLRVRPPVSRDSHSALNSTRQADVSTVHEHGPGEPPPLRPPTSPLPGVAQGIAFHHASDAAFHGSPTFVTLSRETFVELLSRGLPRGSARAIAHVGIEMLFDGVLAADPQAGLEYVAALHSTNVEEVVTTLQWPRDTADATRLQRLCASLASYGVRDDFLLPDPLCDRLVRTLAGHPRLAVPESARPALKAWAHESASDLAARSRCIVAELESALSFPERTPPRI